MVLNFCFCKKRSAQIKNLLTHRNILFRIIGVIGILWGLLACSTMGPIPETQAEVFAMLPQSSELFVSLINQPENKYLWERFTSVYAGDNKRISEALSQTRGLSLACRQGKFLEESYLVLQGRYPGCWINWGLWWDPGWKELASQWGSYWTEIGGGLKIKTLGDRLLMITTGDMELLLKELASFKSQSNVPDIQQRINSNPMFVYFPRFSESEFSQRVPINQKRLPVKEVWLAMEIENDQYNIESQFQLQSNEDASLFSRSFRTFLLWLRKEAAINNFVQRAEVEVLNNCIQSKLSEFTEEEIGRGIDVFQEDDLGLSF